MRQFLLTTLVLVVLFQGFGASWHETFYGIMGIGILMFLVDAMIGAARDIANAFHRDQHNYNLNVTEQHQHGDPTAPEVYPAVIEIEKRIGRRK